MILANLATVQKSSPFDYTFWDLTFGWTILPVLAAAILVSITSIRFWIAARNSHQFRHEALVHGLALIVAATTGVLVHSIREWDAMRYVLVENNSDWYRDAGMQMHIAKQDVYSSAVVLVGALIGVAGSLRYCGYQKTEQASSSNVG